MDSGEVVGVVVVGVDGVGYLGAAGPDGDGAAGVGEDFGEGGAPGAGAHDCDVFWCVVVCGVWHGCVLGCL